MKRTLALGTTAALTLLMSAASVADACSRAVYFGLEGQTVTGRTMDWFISDMDTNMWLYPRGLTRESNTKTPFSWTSKYGSVVTTIYEGATADGMNEAGLVANLLYLPQSVYPPESAEDTRPTLPNSPRHSRTSRKRNSASSPSRPRPVSRERCTCRSPTPRAIPRSSNISTASLRSTTAANTR
jgi:hypothetical protein